MTANKETPPQDNSRKVIYAAILAKVGFATAKFVGAVKRSVLELCRAGCRLRVRRIQLERVEARTEQRAPSGRHTFAMRLGRGMRIDEVDVAIARLEQAVAAFDPAIGRIYFEAAALRSGMR